MHIQSLFRLVAALMSKADSLIVDSMPIQIEFSRMTNLRWCSGFRMPSRCHVSIQRWRRERHCTCSELSVPCKTWASVSVCISQGFFHCSFNILDTPRLHAPCTEVNPDCSNGCTITMPTLAYTHIYVSTETNIHTLPPPGQSGFVHYAKTCLVSNFCPSQIWAIIEITASLELQTLETSQPSTLEPTR